MGDRALVNVPIGPSESNPTGRAALAALATELGVSAQALRNYRYVASVWRPDLRRSAIPWAVHEWLIVDGQPADDLMERLTAGGRVPSEREAACLCRWQTMSQPRGRKQRQPLRRRARSLLASAS
jgi:hypothetical protein